MSASLRSGSDDGSSRRSACDRCRGHKLRCERDAQQSVTGPCRRCLKARARCTTGNALPTGRPPLLRLQNSHSHMPQQQDQQQTQSPFTQLQPTPPSGSPSESDCFSGPWTSAMQPQPAPSPLSIFDAPFLDGDFDFQAFLPPMPQQLPVDASMPDALPQPPAPCHHTPADRRQECLQKLGDLHSALLADLNTVRASKVATESSVPTLRADAAAQEHCGCNVPIGRMLTTSAQFLEILHYFSPPSSPPPQPSSSSSSPPSSSTPSTSSTTLANTPTNCTPPDSEQQQLLRPDLPTTLSILACYAALRRIYRTIFACIDASLQNFPPPLRSAALPPLFPDLALGGFQLGANVGLQVLILAQLSESMLAKIDVALGVGNGDEGGNRGGGGDMSGVFAGNAGAAEMLKVVVREEEAEGPAGEGTPGGCRPLGEIVGSVKRLC